MATITVRQSGSSPAGDFSTLASALADSGTTSGDTISIEGTWSVDDTTACTISDTNLIITTDSESKHPGFLIEETRTGATDYYRHVYGGASDNVDVNASGCTISGIAFISTSTTPSQEAIDYQGADVDIDSCIIHSTTTTNQKDGTYTANTARTLNITNSIITGWARAGVHVQNYAAGSGTHTCDVDSCTIYACALDAGTRVAGGIRGQQATTTVNMSVTNTVSVGNTQADFVDSNNPPACNWVINYCIDSDGSIATNIDSGSDNLASRTETDSDTPGIGDWVVFEDVTSAPYDLRLKTNDENDAEDSGSTALSVDIVGTSRPQGLSSPLTDDRGAFEIPTPEGSPVTSPSIPSPAGFIATALAGIILFTGAAPTLNVGEVLPANAGNVIYTAEQPAVNIGVSGTANSGTVVFNGQQPQIVIGHSLTPTAGDILYSGQQPATARGIAAQGTSGTILYNGQQPAAQVGTILQAAAGSIIFNGQQPALVTGDSFIGQGSAGDIIFNGQQPTAVVGEIKQALSGNIIFNGQQPALLVGAGFIDQGVSGTILFNGQQPALLVGTAVQALSGNIIFNGQQPSVQVGETGQGDAGTIIFNGQQPSLLTGAGFIDQGASGTIVFNGQQPVVISGFVDSSLTGTIVFNGQQPVTISGFIDQAASSEIIFNGQQPALVIGAAFIGQAAAGEIIFNGQQPSVVSGDAFIGQAAAGEIIFNGQQPTVVLGKTLTSIAGAIIFNGHQPALFRRVTTIPGTLVVSLVDDGLTASQVSDGLAVTVIELALTITVVETI